MSIKVGDRLPEATFTTMTADGPKPLTTAEVFTAKKVVLFSVPGAFTPTCSKQHLPGYVKQADDLKAKGVDAIACLAVNDVFVMDAWAKSQGADTKVLMLADGNAAFTRQIGLELDASKYGMGTRSQRFSMIVDDGVVTTLNVEAPGKFEVSSCEATARQL
jgi:glutaredoxin/glutathione-dependent peroxiredoxin